MDEALPPNEYYDYYSTGERLKLLRALFGPLIDRVGKHRQGALLRMANTVRRAVDLTPACRPLFVSPRPLPPLRRAVGYTLRVAPRPEVENTNSADYLEGLR